MEIILTVAHVLAHLLYGFVLKSVCRPYCLISVRIKEPQRKTLLLYTHYEGLQVIDEICVRGQYGRVFKRWYKVVVDLGAHVGIFSVFYAKDAPKGTIVVAVEPVSVNYNLLLANILVNGLSGTVYPIKAAVAPKKGFLDVEWVGCREKVKAITMKEILDLLSKLGHDRIDLLKIDIEGAELDLLTKENSWLSKVNAIVAEIHPQVYGLRGVNEIVTALKGYGFKVLHVTRRIDPVYALRAFRYSVALSPSTFILLLWKLAILVGKTMWGPKKHELKYIFASRVSSGDDSF